MCIVLLLHFAFLSSYVTTIHDLVYTDQRKCSRTHESDVTSHDVGGNSVLFMNCNKAVTQNHKYASSTCTLCYSHVLITIKFQLKVKHRVANIGLTLFESWLVVYTYM